MPAVKRSESSRSVAATSQDAAFTFPVAHHLIITTPEHVHAFHGAGSRNIFRSSSKGILAARETRDGRILAVSDSHNVVLHRIDKGQEKSYRLKGPRSWVRCLEFAPDSQTLFFTTTLLNAVQVYSLAEARLLEPGPLHNSAPTVIAVSPSTHMLLTASENPPVVYLQNRAHRTQPLLHQPLASQTPVVHASFHPDRDNIFSLAFKDGTVAMYDATQLFRNVQKDAGYPQVLGGELQIFRSLHSVTTSGPVDAGDYDISAAFDRDSISSRTRSSGVTGVAFVPGHRSRAVTCGTDGKCRVIDFDKGSIVRSWHARAPASSLSVFIAEPGRGPIVTVGKTDGKVAIYNMSGALLHEIKIQDSVLNGIINVEWIRGPCPKVSGEAEPIATDEPIWIELYTVGGTLRSRRTDSSQGSAEQMAADRTSGESQEYQISDEVVSGTVCRHPVDGSKEETLAGLPRGAYMDLFSPVKVGRSPPKPRASPQRRPTTRHRPRISSSTFVDQNLEQTASNSRAIPSTENSKLGDERTALNTQAIPEAFILSSSSSSPSSSTSNRKTSRHARTQSSKSATQILAGIKQHAGTLSTTQTPGSLALFAPYLPAAKPALKKKQSTDRRRSQTRRRSPGGLSPKKTVVDVTEPESKSKRASGDEDIWLTAESDAESHPGERQSRRAPEPGKKIRRLQWPAERVMSCKLADTATRTQRTTIELAMSPPTSRDLDTKALSRQSTASSGRRRSAHIAARSHAAEARPSQSHAAASTDRSHAITTDTTADDSDDGAEMIESPLPPGFAQSYQGPVSVDRYLPRRSSLAPLDLRPGSSGRQGALGEVSGSEQRVRGPDRKLSKIHDEKTCQCCLKMKDEIQMLREELAELRAFVKGKAKLID